MDWLRTLLSRLQSLFRRSQLDADLDEELRAHLALAIEENLKRGMNEPEARAAALRSFGGVTQIRESYRAQRGLPWLETGWGDLRFALRQLGKSPGFAWTAILTLALGAGAVTAVFSVVDTVLLKPYAFRDPGQLVVWRETVRELEKAAPLLPDNYRHYLNLKAHAHSIQDAAIVQTAGFSVSAGVDHPQMTEGLTVSPNFFSVLGVEPVLGRSFLPKEAQKGRDGEVILTWGAWQRLFHGDASSVGHTVRIGDEPHVIVGILPRTFRFPVVSIMPGQATHGSTDRYEIFKPLVPQPSEVTANDSEFNFLVIARLKTGVSILEAQTELDGIEKATAAAERVAVHLGVVVTPFAQEITGDYRRPLWLLLAAVTGVLLMACINLAGLQIARGVAREPETALRAALGAGRSRLLQGALMENLLLGAAGGCGAILVSVAGVKVLILSAATLPRLNEVRIDVPILVLSLGLSLWTSLAFGLLPALRALRIPPQNALQASSTRLSGHRQAARARKMVVAIEVACSIVLLVITGLIARSFARVLTQDRLFDTEHITIVKADLSGNRYATQVSNVSNAGADRGSRERSALIDRSIDKIGSLPGVEGVAITNMIPLTGDMSVDGIVRPDHPVPEGQVPFANLRMVSPDYLHTMGIPLIAGREFAARDRDNPRVVILSASAAKAAFGEENPLGHTIRHWDRMYTVVGIAADARINDLKREVPMFYLPYWDAPPVTPVFLVRSSLPFAAVAPEIRRSIWSVDSDISIPYSISMQAQVDESVATQRFQAVILSSFGAAALLIAALGIYGVLAYAVSMRKSEFGIRIALGSNRSGLARVTLLDALQPLVAGIVLGSLAAMGAAAGVRSLLYETSAVDPLAIGLALVVLALTTMLASLVPLRKAMSVDPIQALRSE